jgi:hypothetical protein
MSASPSDHGVRVERFCSDLRVLEPTDIIRKYITTGAPCAISNEEYFELRTIVAREFDLHPSSVVVIGSCRTGFSIVPKKRYREVLPSSDLDLALVSSEAFDHHWDNVFSYARANSAWERTPQYRRFVRTLFNGWLDPNGLPPVNRFERAKKWREFFGELMQSRQFGSRRISARLYRTWARLEAYQERAVRKCIANLGGNNA